MARKPMVSAALSTLLNERRQHAWTLEELHAGLAESGVVADFSSVFRAVEKLVAAGDVRKVTLDDGRARFELVDAHHDHLHCTRCGQLVPIPCLLGPSRIAAVERQAGVAILDHHVVLSGLCQECCASASSRTPAGATA